MTLHSGADPNQVVIYPSRARMALVLLGSIVFVVIGVWRGTPGDAERPPIWVVIAGLYVGVPFFAACGLYAGYRLVCRRPALTIDSTGITETASALGAGRLTWEEVDYVVLYKFGGQSMLGIVPKNLEGFLSRQPGMRRFLIKINMALGCAPINVPQVGVSMRLSELAELLQTRHGVRVEGEA
ncbi:MAG: hypothetical protein Kow0062_23420 [Acidobacteriota bacterium]